MMDRIAPKELKGEKRPRFFEPWAKRNLHKVFACIEQGGLRLIDGEEEMFFGDPNTPLSQQAELRVLNPRFYGNTLLGGSIGAAEAYIAGWWTTNDIAEVVRVMTSNIEAMTKMDSGLAWLTQPLQLAYHFMRPNTFKGSRRNIASHYDLGNEFYQLFLDKTLTYSCAVFEKQNMDLAEASIAKYDRLCRKLLLTPDDHVLEIGTGWGGFAIYAAKTYGCRITTTTISKEQFDLAKQRVKEAGLDDKIEILLEDYRQLQGEYDKLVSIEMIEAIGHKQIPIYFRSCGQLLKPNGIAAIQAIVITDYAHKSHRRSVDFIKKYIFPGSCLPSIAEMCRAVAEQTNMRLFDLEDITPHYCRTLREWRTRFLEQLSKVQALKFSESFIRMWEYYLAYCEGAFASNYIGDVQMVFTKPHAQRPPIHLPLPDPVTSD